MRMQSPVTRALLASLTLQLMLSACGTGTETPAAAAGASHHAERTYAEYQEASVGRVAFAVETLDTGRLDALAGEPLGTVLGVPAEWVVIEHRGTEMLDVKRAPRDAQTDEWAVPVEVEEFARNGRSLEEGTYRLLSVHTTVDGTPSEHRALEVCWARGSDCLVMDPVVRELEDFVQNRERLLAEGWAPVETMDLVERGTGVAAQASICSLNSNPSAKSRSRSFSAYRWVAKNVYGITLVEKTMGYQRVGISCYVSNGTCKSSGFGDSDASTCWANVGYSCDCANTGNRKGTTGSSTRSWSETKCAHKAVLSANASFSVKGTGASFSIAWDTSGSVHSNGGQMYDTCSWH